MLAPPPIRNALSFLQVSHWQIKEADCMHIFALININCINVYNYHIISEGIE